MTNNLGYTFENLKNLPSGEVEEKIKHHLSQASDSRAEWRKSVDLLWAQLFIQELGAREQRSQAQIMVRCTVIITILTVVIAVMTGVMKFK